MAIHLKVMRENEQIYRTYGIFTLSEQCRTIIKAFLRPLQLIALIFFYFQIALN